VLSWQQTEALNDFSTVFDGKESGKKSTKAPERVK